MVASLVATGVTVVRGPDTVVDAVDLTLAPGDRIGLVGPNGVGKSTLLAALAGELQLDRGRVELAPRTATVGLLAQQWAGSDASAAEVIAQRTGVTAAHAELDAAAAALACGAPGSEDRYSIALERWLGLGAADFEARLGSVAAELGLVPALLDQPTGALSGGEIARVSLAALLLSSFDVLLLDEPTNDLDLDGLQRLEAWVLGQRVPMVIVSHDRAFLERVVTDVAEIDHHTRRVSRFAGGWSAFLRERELARVHAQQRYDTYATQRQTLLDRAQREREWAAQGRAKVRRSDEGDKFVRHYKINQTEQLAGRSARTLRALERLEEVDEPREAWELRLTIPDPGRSGDRVAWATDAVVERENFRLGPVDVQIDVGDRVAVVGANGAGKSTLVQLLLGRIDPVQGVAGLGRGVAVGEIDQVRAALADAPTLLIGFTAATGLVDVEARTLLAKFGLTADHVHRHPSTLSPGERTRTALALLQAQGANLLVLDEPTNHLDIEAIEQLEQALESFRGTILLVTHDRMLLDRVHITRTLQVAGGGVTELPAAARAEGGPG